MSQGSRRQRRNRCSRPRAPRHPRRRSCSGRNGRRAGPFRNHHPLRWWHEGDHRAINHRRPDKRSQIVHDVHLTPDGILAKITGERTLGVNSTHHQAVEKVAGPLQVTAASNDGMIEGLELRHGAANWLPFLLSVQFHPERLADRYPEHRAIFRAFTQACVLDRSNKL